MLMSAQAAASFDPHATNRNTDVHATDDALALPPTGSFVMNSGDDQSDTANFNPLTQSQRYHQDQPIIERNTQFNVSPRHWQRQSLYENEPLKVSNKSQV